jgi:murein DD-endopeptidase MepM/ murein hydrolase activator NlpD
LLSLILMQTMVSWLGDSARAFYITEPHNANAMWVEPATITFENESATGRKFNITVSLNMTVDIFAYQTVLYYNRTYLKCTSAGFTAGAKSEYFAGHGSTLSISIDSTAYGNGSVLGYETCSSPDFIDGPHQGTLMWMEFQVVKVPLENESFTSKFDISTEYPSPRQNTFVEAPNGDYLNFTTYDGTCSINPQKTANSFRFPLDGLWTISQRFGGYNYDWNGYHLGEDMLRSFEAPVFAPADGVVKHNANRTGYGYVVIIEHQLMDGTFVCSVLGHLREADCILVGTKVTKGQIVGYLSSIPGENGGILHLHFGIRKGAYSEELDFDGKWRYRGYGPIDIVGSWCPPSAFIEYYNENKEMPPNYSLTINTQGGGAFVTTSSTSVFTLVYKTILTLISPHPWFLYWIGTDNDISNPTTVTMNSPKVVTEVRSSEAPPPCPTPWQLAIDLIGADYNYGGARGWNWSVEKKDGGLINLGWGVGNRWAGRDEIIGGYYYWDNTVNPPEGGIGFGKGVDCSGLVYWAYNKASGIGKYRDTRNPIQGYTAETQFRGDCEDITTQIRQHEDELRPGDLLFFDARIGHGDPDHVAMYVGDFQYDLDGNGQTETYNVVHSTVTRDGIVAKVTPARYDALTEELATPEPDGRPDDILAVDYYGRPTPWDTLKPIRCTSKCPVDLIITDPDGIVLTKGGEAPGMLYTEMDLDGDGDLDDMINIWEPKAGNYLVSVLPELGASPADTFTLEVSANGTTILLADHAQISEVPTDPYIVTSNSTAIMLRNINVALTNTTISKNVVGQGYSLPINATVQNQGNLEETFNITVYANATIIGSENVTIPAGDSTTLTYTWNTTGFAVGNYTVWAYAEPVSGETELADNTFVGGVVQIIQATNGGGGGRMPYMD